MANLQQWKEPTKDKHLNFCHWMLNVAIEGHLDPLMFIMTDVAWFHLLGYVNSQNSVYWVIENPHEVHKQPLRDQKIGVCSAVSTTRTIGPMFFNTDVYLV